MGSRREGRELALQALYQLDMTAATDGDEGLRLFWSHFDRPGEVRDFARELVDGVCRRRPEIDALIDRAAQHWRLSRLSKVDLNLLRLATYELMERAEIPASVTLNEAVEIARRFGTEESAGFVNGVLDAVARTLAGEAAVKEGPVE